MLRDSQDTAMSSYLDHAATTRVHAVALEAMLPFLAENYANPSGVYSAGRAARRAIDDARDTIAGFCGCEPGEVVFTSGGTEADNLAVQGVASRGAGPVVTSTIEHHAVLNPARRAKARLVGATAGGIIDLEALEGTLDDSVALVSVMTVNNELGTIQPIAEVVDFARRRAPGALVHTDAVQAAPWFDLADLCGACDLLSISGHKIGGPKGVGALILRKRARGKLLPIVVGGGQERSMRPGTENVAGIVGMAAAANESAAQQRPVRRPCAPAARPLPGRNHVVRGCGRDRVESDDRAGIRPRPISGSARRGAARAARRAGRRRISGLGVFFRCDRTEPRAGRDGDSVGDDARGSAIHPRRVD